MIIWINGTFGVGKTAAARELTTHITRTRVCDPENLGYWIRECLDAPRSDDFQDWPAWRQLVSEATYQLEKYTIGHLIVPQTLLRRAYYDQIMTEVRRRNTHIFVAMLDASEHVLRRRIESAAPEQSNPERHEATRVWRLRHLDEFAHSRRWMIHVSDFVIDTSRLTVARTASILAEAIRQAE